MARRLGALALMLLVASVPLAQAVTYGAVNGSTDSGASTSRSAPLPAGTLPGHLLLAHVAHDDGTGASITPPAGWTLRTHVNNSGNVALALYFRIATGSEPPSYTWTFGKNVKSSVSIVRYVDVNGTSPFDGSTTAAFANGTTLTLPSVTTTTAGARLVAFVASHSATTFTPASGMTERYDGGTTVAIEAADVALAAAGASGTKAVTAASNVKMAGVMLALRKATPPTVSLDKTSSSAWESNGTVRYWANLSYASQVPITVAYTVGGSATGGGGDHTLATGTLTFAAGQTSKGINASVVNDAVAEANETITITLGTFTNVTGGAVTAATHTIVNDDTTVGFATPASSVAEGVGTYALNVSLGTASPQSVSVSYSAAPGTASSGSDYVLAAGTITFAPWQTTRSLPLAIVADALDELDEGLTLTLSAPVNTLLATSSHQVTILDDDATPSVTLPASASFAEAASPTVNATLSAPSGLPVSVSYAATAGSATIPGDVASAAGTLIFAPGETTKSIPLALVQDALDEADETFTLSLAAPANATLAGASSVLTIVDDDAPPTLRFTTASVSASEAGALPHPTVELSAPSGLSVGVVVSVTGGTAGPSEFTGGAATLVIPPGGTRASVPIAAVDDDVDEGDKSVILGLSAPTNATLGAPSTHTLVILDDEAPVTVRFAQADAQAPESGGARTAEVVLSGPSESPIAVDYWWAEGSATVGEDFTASAGQLVIAPGATNGTIPFTLLDDEAVEPDETIVLALSAATNASLAGATTHTFTLLNDDAPYPVVGFPTEALALAEGSPSPSLSVTLSSPQARVATVDYAISGTATPGEDFAFAAGTLTFQPGETSKMVAYIVVDDAVVEPNETIVVTLTSPTRLTLGQATFTRTLVNDDVAPPVVAFAAASSTASESASTVALRVALDRAATAPVSVAYAVTGGTATGDAVDYALPSGLLTFDVGESAKDIVVVLSDDPLVEPLETVQVALSTPSGATLGAQATHTLGITSDDVAPVTIAFAASSSAAPETAGIVQLVVTASTASLTSYEVSYAATGGSAAFGVDYVLAAGTLLFEPGVTTRTFTVEVLDDATYEVDETIVLQLSNPTYGALGSPSSHVLTIQNDDAQPPTFSFAAASGSANEGAGDVSISVVLAPAASAPATVSYAVTGGSATSGVDYTLQAGVLTFAAGETAKSVTLRLLDDAAVEPTETVLLGLSSATGALLGSSEHVFSILNDDSVLPTVQWNLTASTASEGAGSAIVRAYLSSSATSAVTVSYSVTGGTATGGGVDFTLAAGTLTFAPGETSRAVSIPLVDDASVEGDETLLLTLASPSGATLGSQTTHTLTILENDVAQTTLVTVATAPVLADGSPQTGVAWGGWSAEPGATNVGSTNYLKLVNSGTFATPRVVISFGTGGFVGATDPSSVIPTAGNLQFAWWEDATPGSSAPSEGSFTFGPASPSASVTVQFGGAGRIVYVAYRIVQMPEVLAQQAYGGSYTVTEL